MCMGSTSCKIIHGVLQPHVSCGRSGCFWGIVLISCVKDVKVSMWDHCTSWIMSNPLFLLFSTWKPVHISVAQIPPDAARVVRGWKMKVFRCHCQTNLPWPGSWWEAECSPVGDLRPLSSGTLKKITFFSPFKLVLCYKHPNWQLEQKTTVPFQMSSKKKKKLAQICNAQ